MSDVVVMGLGAMGSALVGSLLNAGIDVAVWNRTRARAEPWAAQGARVVESISEAFGAAPVIVVCVIDHDAVRAITNQAPADIAGKHLISLTNGTPSQAVELDAWVSARGGHFLDGAVLVTPELVGTSDSTIVFSGDTRTFEAARPLFTCWGHLIYLGEDVTAAAVDELALLSAMFGMFAGYLHAAALLRAKGRRVTEANPRIQNLLQAMCATLPAVAEQIDTEIYPEPTSNNRMMTAALSNVVHGTRELGVRTDLVRPILELFQRGVDQGLGALDVAALSPLLRDPLSPSTSVLPLVQREEPACGAITAAGVREGAHASHRVHARGGSR